MRTGGDDMTTMPKAFPGPRPVSERGGAPSLEELLATLPVLAAEARAADDRLREQVALLKDRRATWAEIGSALNVTRQAAWERFAGAHGGRGRARAGDRAGRSASR